MLLSLTNSTQVVCIWKLHYNFLKQIQIVGWFIGECRSYRSYSSNRKLNINGYGWLFRDVTDI